MDMLHVIGKNVHFLRETLGYSQEELATIAGLHRAYIGHIERGERNLSINNLCQIAAALQTHPSSLLIENAFPWKGK